MAYVIAVCGSGGKTTLVKSLANKYANENKKVCVTTTTHMWDDEDVKAAFISRGEFCEPGKVYYIANVNVDKELITSLSDKDYKQICEEFDYVIIEADGSRSMPMKIPRSGEPAIPDNVDEIIIVVGMEAIGRKISAVCHRFNDFYGKDEYLSSNNIDRETIVTEELLDSFVKHYYYDPLSSLYSGAKVSIYKNSFYKTNADYTVRDGETLPTSSLQMPHSIAIVLLASGFSRRFGSNKLLFDIKVDDKNQKLYQLMIDKLISVKDKLIDKLNNINQNIKIDVAVVSQYDEILTDKNYTDKVTMIKNEDAILGMSESIKKALNHYKNASSLDAMVFVNADMPHLPDREVANFIFNSILNKNGIGVMYSNDYKNPAYFEKKYFDDLMALSGDKGARDLFDKYKMHLYKYYIDDKYLLDIDTKDDCKGVL